MGQSKDNFIAYTDYQDTIKNFKTNQQDEEQEQHQEQIEKGVEDKMNTEKLKISYTAEIISRIKKLCKDEFTIQNQWWIVDGSQADLIDPCDGQEYIIKIIPKPKKEA